MKQALALPINKLDCMVVEREVDPILAGDLSVHRCCALAPRRGASIGTFERYATLGSRRACCRDRTGPY